jgi:hypothetical protein
LVCPFRGLTAGVAGCQFPDENQRGKPARREMLKMKIAPRISLKINGKNIQILIMPTYQ